MHGWRTHEQEEEMGGRRHGTMEGMKWERLRRERGKRRQGVVDDVFRSAIEVNKTLQYWSYYNNSH